VLDNHGRSNFAKLARGQTGTHYYAFDLLMRGDADLRTEPLEERKAMLANLLLECDEPVRHCDHIVGKGEAFFDAVQEAGLEDIVAKRRDSAYAGVLNNDWLKIKCLLYVFESGFRIATEQVHVFIDVRFNSFEIFVHPRSKTLKTSRNHMCEFVVRGVLLFLGYPSHRRAVGKSVKSVSQAAVVDLFEVPRSELPSP
jgi:hypothetical protein